jgi:hypothetical protein
VTTPIIFVRARDIGVVTDFVTSDSLIVSFTPNKFERIITEAIEVRDPTVVPRRIGIRFSLIFFLSLYIESASRDVTGVKNMEMKLPPFW